MSAGRRSVTENKDWCTPHKYVNAVKCVFNGKIDLDPCSSECSVVGADTEFLLPQTDGLSVDWNYSTVYVNPPYGNDKERKTTIKHWFRKIAISHKTYNCEVIALVPVATNTAHWKEYVYPVASAVCFLYDTRLKFIIGGNEDNKGAPMSCAAIYYGNNVSKFLEVFAEYGAALPLADIKLPAQTVSTQIDLFSLQVASSM